MAKYDANFDLDTLYYVAREMDHFDAGQDKTLSDIESETFYFEQVAREAISIVKQILEREILKLKELQSRLEDAIWNLSNCKRTDENGDSTGEYEYWSRVVDSLENDVAKQEEKVERVRSAYDQVQSRAADLFSRAANLRSLIHSYSSAVSSCGAGAATAIKHCAEAMSGYWNKDF